ncbi:nitrate- and nitrite sensing domain-containing protein [Microbispora sp. H11081]|uniref:sensor histidine kinase n=1 Tax=Microbispora sp. H11081 TaxID=2729107 RepID=UPI0028992D5C|nr:nitrate- and nitrite sensing domain-containing protein [Microbispora sp. H11081]
MRTATIESGRRAEPEPVAEPTAGAPSVNGAPPADPATGNSIQLKNWRVRTRLVALIVLPTVVAVLLGGLRVTSSIASAAEYQRVRDAVELVGNIGVLLHEIQLERDLSVKYVAGGRRDGDLLTLVNNQQDAVNAAAQQVRARAGTSGDALGELGRADLSRALARLADLTAFRKIVLDSQLPALRGIEKYRLVTDDLLKLYDAAGQGVPDEGLYASIKALGALVRAKEAVSEQRALLAAGLVRQRLDQAELDAFTGAAAREQSELAAFTAVATTDERQLYNDTVTDQKVDRARFFIDRALYLVRSGQPIRNLSGRGTDADLWFDAISEQADLMRDVTDGLTTSIVARSTALQDSDRNVAVLSVSMVVVVLVLVLLITAVMARSLVRPLRRLRSEALEVAGHRLPALVQRLRDSDAGAAAQAEVQPIGVVSADEIGEVARAFDEVHREAIRLAGDEARLRSNVNAMFVNLSRRTQTLVERQITLIDGLEQGEQDEQRLGDLFKLDHLATRMRRNSENLLVLAGQEPARRWSRPVEITDVIRASLSEVEGYERVMLNFPGDVSIAGQAVNDVIHLLAELVENALSFSPRDTRVVVSGNRIDGGGVMISVTDSGIGMTPDEIAQANWRLANPPVVDVSVSRRMGLFVVGRLAVRNGIRVQLRPHDGGGLTAMVLLPESIVSRPAFQPESYQGAFAPGWSPRQAGQGSPQQAIGEWGRQNAPAAGVAAPTLHDPLSRLRGRSSGMDEAATGPLPAVTGPVPASPAFMSSGAAPATTGPVAVSGPIHGAPVAYPAGAETGPQAAEEYLPIFASVESAWFRREPAGDTGSGWQQTPAVEAGWQAAAAVTEKPASDGTTISGLPKRVPKANLVPGSAEPPAAPAAASPQPLLSPDRARSRLASFQRGVRQGRAVARGELSEDEGYPTAKGDGA